LVWELCKPSQKKVELSLSLSAVDRKKNKRTFPTQQSHQPTNNHHHHHHTMITTSPPGSSSTGKTPNSKKKNQQEEKQRERELIEDTDQAWDDHSDQEDSKTTATQAIIRTRKLSLENHPSQQAHQSTPPPTIQSKPLDQSDPIESPSSSPSSTHSTFAKDIFNLIKGIESLTFIQGSNF
jgi:hypothetical protein